jgi:hypothetical protein
VFVPTAVPNASAVALKPKSLLAPAPKLLVAVALFPKLFELFGPPMVLLALLPLPKVLVRLAPVAMVELPLDVSVVNAPVLPEIGVFEIAPPVIVALLVVNELSVARPEVVSVVKVVLPVTPSVPARVVAPDAASVVNEPVPPVKEVPVTAPALEAVKLPPVFWNEPPVIKPPAVIVPPVEIGPDVELIAPEPVEMVPVVVLKLLVVSDKLSITLIGVPFGLPLRFVVLTVVKVPIGTTMLVKIAPPVLLTLHELLLPTTSLPVPGAPPLIVTPTIAPVGNSVISRPVISPAPFTRNEPAVFEKPPAVTVPVRVAEPPVYVVKFAVVPVIEVTVIGPLKFEDPFTVKALPGPGAVTANATPAPVFVTPSIPVAAPELPVNCEPVPVVPDELIVPVALIDVGAPVMLIPRVVALSEIPVANGSTLIPVPAPAPVTLIPPSAPAGALMPIP